MVRPGAPRDEVRSGRWSLPEATRPARDLAAHAGLDWDGRNLDGGEPRCYLSAAPEDTTLQTLAYVGGLNWRIEA